MKGGGVFTLDMKNRLVNPENKMS